MERETEIMATQQTRRLEGAELTAKQKARVGASNAQGYRDAMPEGTLPTLNDIDVLADWP
jgi:hypothetical protein